MKCELPSIFYMLIEPLTTLPLSFPVIKLGKERSDGACGCVSMIYGLDSSKTHDIQGLV